MTVRQPTVTSRGETWNHKNASYFDLDASGIDFVDALDEQVRDGGAGFGQVLRQVDAERGHLARKTLVAALDRQALQAFFVTAQTTLQRKFEIYELDASTNYSIIGTVFQLGATCCFVKMTTMFGMENFLK